MRLNLFLAGAFAVIAVLGTATSAIAALNSNLGGFSFDAAQIGGADLTARIADPSPLAIIGALLLGLGFLRHRRGRPRPEVTRHPFLIHSSR